MSKQAIPNKYKTFHKLHTHQAHGSCLKHSNLSNFHLKFPTSVLASALLQVAGLSNRYSLIFLAIAGLFNYMLVQSLPKYMETWTVKQSYGCFAGKGLQALSLSAALDVPSSITLRETHRFIHVLRPTINAALLIGL